MCSAVFAHGAFISDRPVLPMFLLLFLTRNKTGKELQLLDFQRGKQEEERQQTTAVFSKINSEMCYQGT